MTLSLTQVVRLAASITAVLVVAAASAQPARESPREMIDRLVAELEAAPDDGPAETPAAAEDATPDVPAATVDLDAAVIGVLPGEPLPKLRREGEFVIQRPGRLLSVAEGAYWVFAFDVIEGSDQPRLRPMIVQKCQRLASMQDTLEQRQGEDAGFTLTGQVHTYRGVNYLLPTAISGTRQTADADDLAAAEAAAAAAEDAAPAGGFEEPFDAAPLDPQTPATFGGGGATSGGGDPIELMERMLDDRDAAPTRPDTVPVAAAYNAELDETLRGIRPDDDEAEPLRREGEYLIDRAGRLVRGITGGDTNMLFAFEADGVDPAAAEAPMLLLPCRLLELMEDTVVERGDQAVFLVSGRVHAYRGANYLLPTTVRVRYDEASFGP
ncbi:MAG: hypothetical protein AAF710_03895 [Planctomycetota bacterium]